MAPQSLLGQGLLIIEASRSHSDTPHLVGLLWMSDQPDAETSTWQHTALISDRDMNAPSGIRTRNSSKRAAANPHLKPCGQRDRLSVLCHQIVFGLSNQEEWGGWGM